MRCIDDFLGNFDSWPCRLLSYLSSESSQHRVERLAYLKVAGALFQRPSLQPVRWHCCLPPLDDLRYATAL